MLIHAEFHLKLDKAIRYRLPCASDKGNGMKVSLESEWYEECLSDILVLSIEI